MGAVRTIPGLTDLGNSFEWMTTPVPLGFPFWGWDEVLVSGYGTLTFNAINNVVTPEPLDWYDDDNTRLFTGMFPLWVDAYAPDDPSGAATVYYGQCEVEGLPSFAATWSHTVPQSQVTGGTPVREATFQAIISAGGRIEFNYDEVGFSVGDYTAYTSLAFPNAQYPGAVMGWHRITYANWLIWEGGSDAPNDYVQWDGSLYSETLDVVSRKDTQTQNSPLLDGGSNALVSNSLNSGVLGRYIWWTERPTYLRQRQSPVRAPSRVSWKAY